MHHVQGTCLHHGRFAGLKLRGATVDATSARASLVVAAHG